MWGVVSRSLQAPSSSLGPHVLLGSAMLEIRRPVSPCTEHLGGHHSPKGLVLLQVIIRVYADVHNTNPAYPENCESPEFFMELYDAGINLQLTNHGFMMCKLIAEKFAATEY